MHVHRHVEFHARQCRILECVPGECIPDDRRSTTWTSTARRPETCLRLNPRVTHTGDIVLYAATAAEAGDFTSNNGFIEDFGGGSDWRGWHRWIQVCYGCRRNRERDAHQPGNRGASSDCAAEKPDGGSQWHRSISRLSGAFANDGVNDAVILQTALNNPAYTDVYLPPGVYHFDRTVFIPSNKSVRGANYATPKFARWRISFPFVSITYTGAEVSNLTIRDRKRRTPTMK